MMVIVITALSAAAALGIGLLSGTGGLDWLWVLPLGFAGGFAALGLLAFLFLWLMCALVDLDKPQEHDSRFYRQLIYAYLPAINFLLRLRVETRGLEKTPKEGRFLLVCNHLNDMDPVVLMDKFQSSQLAFISKRENTSMFLVGKVMHKLMCQLVNRENDREALKTILRCIQLLKEDEVSVAVFPEGYTSVNGKLQHFRPGVFKIALKANVPIVVCTVQNTETVFHNALRLKPSTVQLHLLDVLPPESLKGRTAVDVSNQVYQMMLEDLGPKYAPVEEENS